MKRGALGSGEFEQSCPKALLSHSSFSGLIIQPWCQTKNQWLLRNEKVNTEGAYVAGRVLRPEAEISYLPLSLLHPIFEAESL